MIHSEILTENINISDRILLKFDILEKICYNLVHVMAHYSSQFNLL